jgi:hypothetical protein
LQNCFDILNDVSTKDMQQVLMLDGYVESFLDCLLKCCEWLGINYKVRRLYIICSQSAMSHNLDDEVVIGAKFLFVPSWTRNEYRQALKNRDIFENVKQKLDPIGSLENVENLDLNQEGGILDQILDLKFYYAGGCCRFMFGYTTDRVCSEIRVALATVSEIILYFTQSIEVNYANVANKLFGCKEINGVLRPFIISQFASYELALKLGPSTIINLRQSLL